MLKKLTALIFSCLIILGGCLTASAYEPTSFSVSAESGILVSLDTGEVLFEKNIDKKVYPASITKIMTAIIILESEKYNPTAKIAMREDVDGYITGTGSAVSTLKVGEEITELELVYMVLMSSAGDCAYLAALNYGETVENFVALMNKKAKELGLDGTSYGNPVGLHDEQTYTTVRDIRTLATYALKNETFVEVTAKSRYKVAATNMSGERTLSTTNFLQDTTTNYFYQYAKGIKTGFTDEAGRCLVSTASKDGYNYLCILMKCPNDGGNREEFIESRELYRWAFNDFEYKQVADTENPVCEVGVDLSFDTDYMPVYIKDGFVTILPKNADMSTVKIETHLDKKVVDAPIKKGDKLGSADVIYAEKIIGRVELVAGSSVEGSGLLKIVRAIKRFFVSDGMKIVYGIIALAIVIFIIKVIRLNAGRGKKRKVKYMPYKDDEE